MGVEDAPAIGAGGPCVVGVACAYSFVKMHWAFTRSIVGCAACTFPSTVLFDKDLNHSDP